MHFACVEYENNVRYDAANKNEIRMVVFWKVFALLSKIWKWSCISCGSKAVVNGGASVSIYFLRASLFS